MSAVILRACAIWLLFIPLGILNGIARETLLAPLVGGRLALPLSGVSLALLIVAATVLLIPWVGEITRPRCRLIGGIWLALTVFFEFFFGRVVMGHPWATLLEAYDPRGGNLWVAVLLVIAAAPCLAARLRKLA